MNASDVLEVRRIVAAAVVGLRPDLQAELERLEKARAEMEEKYGTVLVLEQAKKLRGEAEGIRLREVEAARQHAEKMQKEHESLEEERRKLQEERAAAEAEKTATVLRQRELEKEARKTREGLVSRAKELEVREAQLQQQWEEVNALKRSVEEARRKMQEIRV